MDHELSLNLRTAASAVNAQAWIVGGYVRDHLLGRESHDLDVVVADGKAMVMAEHFGQLSGASDVHLFPRFGTAQVALPDLDVEFVSARKESYADDSRRPLVRPGSLEDDLLRRDFTINAILIDLAGNVIDPLGGRDDMQHRLIRTPSDPRQTFADDPLRMFRAIRFAAELEFTVAIEALEAIEAMRLLAQPPKLSVERINVELRKMLLSPNPRYALELLDSTGLLELVLPELWACHGVEQNEHHRADVFWHTLFVLEATEADLLLRLAALFHDVGKPLTRGEGGTFYGHQNESARLARGAMERLRFSTQETETVVKLIRLHMQPMNYRPQWGTGAVRRLVRDAGDQLLRLLDLAEADAKGSADPHPALADLRRRSAEAILETPSRFELPIDGDDVMAVLGLRPGPEVGRVLKAVGDLVLDGIWAPERSRLLSRLPELAVAKNAKISQQEGRREGHERTLAE